jgi:integrase
MPKLKLTTRAIAQLPPSLNGQTLYRDTQLRGFGVRVCRRSTTYFVEGQVKRRTVRVTVGRADRISIEQARREGRQLLADMDRGINPNKVKREEKAQLTVASGFARFFEAKPNLAPSTRDGYHRTCELYLKDWRRMPLRDISRQMILAQHRKIGMSNGETTANNVMRHLRSVYNFAAAISDDLPPNPVLILTQGRLWNREQRRRSLIASHQLPGWWRAVWGETEDARDVLLLALFTGMRRSEIITLKWEMVDLVGKVLHLPKTKNGDPLELPLSAFIAQLLDQRRNRIG